MQLCGPNNSPGEKGCFLIKKKKFKEITCFREMCKLRLLGEKKVILCPKVSKILTIRTKEVEEKIRPLHKVELVSFVGCP